ncbi:MAG: alpha/beta hydrolase [Planctomycetes bacterium]|nr:alpha/beta hydrolase [Planctomycetota bacterium]
MDLIGKEGFVDSEGVKIHYVTQGEGPLVVMIHGFPDFWFTWRRQIPALARDYQVVAIDLRGFNLSDQPRGVDNYTLTKLVGDLRAVVRHFGRERATLVGHDWGGMAAWTYAMMYPEEIDRLVILNVPHPKGLHRELAHNPRQQRASQYAREFQKDDAALRVPPELLISWIKDPEARREHQEALQRSSLEGMLNLYKANYPREPYTEGHFPPVTCPVLLIHGLEDPYLLPGALNGTWEWVEKDLTLVTVPGAGHWVHQDAADLVNRTMVDWLRRREKS